MHNATDTLPDAARAAVGRDILVFDTRRCSDHAYKHYGIASLATVVCFVFTSELCRDKSEETKENLLRNLLPPAVHVLADHALLVYQAQGSYLCASPILPITGPETADLV
ncbi:hypothetical protein EVAR_66593_1 [Eumeta japonica]|uniref:Uncharacterized protein n=1 Tax=Eumeta variegata TaxID=151549 RepID=A0A4C1ZSF3_EUMVA|nr:hypothetical protein EVAR_66593_1 [Eumeta japonica]